MLGCDRMFAVTFVSFRRSRGPRFTPVRNSWQNCYFLLPVQTFKSRFWRADCFVWRHSVAQNGDVTSRINPLTPNDPYSGRTAPLTSKRCILYIYLTNKGTEYFKLVYTLCFFCVQNTVCFIILTYLVPVLFTFYIQGVLKLNNSGAKRLNLPLSIINLIFLANVYPGFP